MGALVEVLGHRGIALTGLAGEQLPPAGSAVRQPLRLLVVDDERIVREGVRAMLRGSDAVDVVGDADGHEAAMAAAEELHPDVVVVGLPPGERGLDLCAALSGRWPRPAVVVLSSDVTHETVLAAWRAGARGFLLRSVDPAQLVSAARAVVSGEFVLDPLLGGRLVARLVAGRSGTEDPEAPAGAVGAPVAGNRAAGGLSVREREVLVHVSRGLSNGRIARELYISEETVRSHVKAILRKLHASDRSQAVAIAVRSGLCD